MPQPESISTPVVQMPATQTVVTSIPPEASRTLTRNKWIAVWSIGGAVLLTLLDFASQALSDPTISGLFVKYMSLETRIAVVAAILAITRFNWKQRLDTAQPIIGSTGEARAKEESR